MQKNAKKNVQITGVATATTNGNGNGNGKKANPKNNVRVVEEFDSESAVKITPHFPVLATKGVEMYTDMGNLENAKLFIDGLAMAVQDDTELTGLMMIFDAIERKIEENDKSASALDYINWLQDYIFNWTSNSTRCRNAYIEAVRSGNFVVGRMPENDNEVWAEGIYPPKYKKNEQLSALTETVKNLQDKFSEKKIDTVSRIKPQAAITFETVKNANVDEIGLILSALKDNENLPVKMSDAIYDFITLSADPNNLEDSDYDPQFVAECIRRERLNAEKKDADSSQLEPADFEGMYLSEFWQTDGETPNRSLLLEIQQFPGEPSPRIVTSVYRKRTDGRFVLVINYLPDSIEEYPYSSEEPAAETDDSENKRERNIHHRLQIQANQICHILKSDKVSDDMKESFTSIIFEAGNEAGMGVTDPDLIKVAFPKIINSFEFNYGSGIVLAIDALLDSFLGSEFYETELRQYEGRLEDAQKNDLASHLSAVLNNPETPESLYSAISDELTTLFDGKELTKITDSPEFIRKALKKTALAA